MTTLNPEQRLEQPSRVGIFAGAHGFERLALASTITTLLMIVIGAITRVTESGMGCGPYWPSCNGHLIPAFEDITVVIEYGHRLFALVVGLFVGLMAWRAWRGYRAERTLFVPAMLALALFFSQSAVGALTVAVYNQWVSVLIHLGNSMLLLAACLVTWAMARNCLRPTPPSQAIQLPPMAVWLATLLSFAVAMVGAAVAGTNAAKACIGYPLCAGELLPTAQGPLQMLHMTHRLLAGGLGLLLLLMLVAAWRAPSLRKALLLALLAYLAQAGLGASIVLIDSQGLLTLSKALHVVFAALTWSMMVLASVNVWIQLSLASAPNQTENKSRNQSRTA
jgi:heme A synthase